MVRTSAEVIAVLSSLSDLDQGILRCTAAGLTSKEIAPLVGRSHHTVDDRLKAIVRRLGCRTRQQAGRTWLLHESGLDPLSDWGPQTSALLANQVLSSGSYPDGDAHDDSDVSRRQPQRSPHGGDFRYLLSAADRAPAPYSRAADQPSVRTVRVRPTLSAHATSRGRYPDRELGRDSEAVPRSVCALGQVGPSRHDTRRPTELGLRIPREDSSRTFRDEPYAFFDRYAEAADYLDLEPRTLKAVRLLSHLLFASLACAALILLVITCIEAAA